MRHYPVNEAEFLNRYEVDFRIFWNLNRINFYTTYTEYDYGFPQFLEVVFSLWNDDLLKNQQ